MGIGIGTHASVHSTSNVASIATGGITTTASGSTFVVGITTDASFGATPVTDSKGNTYTQIGSEVATAGGKHRLYYKENGTGGSAHTFTVTPGSSQFCAIYALEITGGLTSGILDQNNDNQDSSSPFTSPSITTTQAAEALVSFIGDESGSNPATHAESTGFTIQESQENGAAGWTGGLATRLVSSTGSYNSSFTVTGAADSAVFIASFKEAGGGGAATWGPLIAQKNNRLIQVQ